MEEVKKKKQQTRVELYSRIVYDDLNTFQKFLDFEYLKYLKLYCSKLIEKNHKPSSEELVKIVYNSVLKRVKYDYEYYNKYKVSSGEVCEVNSVRYNFDIGDGEKRFAMYHTNDKRIALLYGKSLTKGIAELVLDIFNQLNRYGYKFECKIKKYDHHFLNIIEFDDKIIEFDASGFLSNYYNEKLDLKKRKNGNNRLKKPIRSISSESVSSLMVLGNLGQVMNNYNLFLNRNNHYLQIVVTKRGK